MNRNIDLSALTDEEILQFRICDLPLDIEGSWLSECIDQLYTEFELKGIKFKPKCYLADEWLTPDDEPIIGVPFFLAHPALMRIEKKMMLDIEGGTKQWCMKLLRHEAGHAINYAYKLYRRKKWQDIFGPFKAEYGDTYRFRPYSKYFVRHLENYYAQYHPDEDFSETFAVWLTPEIDWRSLYKGWKAIEKLQYVDEVMSKVKGQKPVCSRGKRYWQQSRLRIKLANYYKKKRQYHSEDFPDFHDENLREIFVNGTKNAIILPYAAGDLIKKYRKMILNNVSQWTGERKFIIDGLLKKLILRCRELGLFVYDSESQALLRISVYVTSLIMNYMYTGQFRSEK